MGYNAYDMKKNVYVIIYMMIALFIITSCNNNAMSEEAKRQEAVNKLDPASLVSDVLSPSAGGVTVSYSLEENQDEAVSALAAETTADGDCILTATASFTAYATDAGMITGGSIVYTIPGTVTSGKFSANGSCTIETTEDLVLGTAEGNVPVTIADDKAYITITASVSGNSVDKSTVNASVSISSDAAVSYDDNPVRTPVDAVATIGSREYSSLPSAFFYANSGDTITLASDAVLHDRIVIKDKKVTLDLAGYEISVDDKYEVTSGIIRLEDKADLTINDSGNGTGAIDVQTGRDMESSPEYPAVWAAIVVYPKENPAKLTINGGSFLGTLYAVSGNGNCTAENITDITINGGYFEAPAGTAVYHPQNGKLAINGGVFLARDSAVEIRGGSLSIGNGKFTSTATAFSSEKNGNGTTTAGAAIVVVQHTTKLQINVGITGGEFSGVHAFFAGNTQKTDAFSRVELSISGGTFTSTSDSEAAVNIKDVNAKPITGGTFSSDPSIYVADDYKATVSGSDWNVTKN